VKRRDDRDGFDLKVVHNLNLPSADTPSMRPLSRQSLLSRVVQYPENPLYGDPTLLHSLKRVFAEASFGSPLDWAW
jgi:hypothetical protein